MSQAIEPSRKTSGRAGCLFAASILVVGIIIGSSCSAIAGWLDTTVARCLGGG